VASPGAATRGGPRGRRPGSGGRRPAQRRDERGCPVDRGGRRPRGGAGGGVGRSPTDARRAEL